MLRLAFDCSGDLRSVAVVRDDVVEASRAETGARGHAEAMVPLLERTLDAAGRRWRDIDEIAVAIGPGSFTGIRIATATARALALALARPVRPVTTLDALLAAGDGEASLAAIDARRGGVYFALARDGAGTAPRLHPAAAALDVAAAAAPSDLVAIGSGAALVVAAAGRGRAIEAPVDAAAVARCAAGAAATGVPPSNGFDLRPLYLRAADAEPMAA